MTYFMFWLCDAAGALKLHTAAPVQYFRPEIVGFVCGSFLISMATKEYRSTAGSAPMVRFLLGAVMMIGALVFLGCPLRMVLRMSAYVGEESGALDEILEKTADYYEEEADAAVTRLVGLMEPLLIVFMGVAIGLCLAGIFPLLYGSLSGLEN